MQLFTGLSIYKLTRSSNLLNFIHLLDLSVIYFRIWEIVNRIAKSIEVKMNANERVYLPMHIIRGIFTHFAIDNIGFQEDTPGGRNTWVNSSYISNN